MAKGKVPEMPCVESCYAPSPPSTFRNTSSGTSFVFSEVTGACTFRGEAGAGGLLSSGFVSDEVEIFWAGGKDSFCAGGAEGDCGAFFLRTSAKAFRNWSRCTCGDSLGLSGERSGERFLNASASDARRAVCTGEDGGCFETTGGGNFCGKEGSRDIGCLGEDGLASWLRRAGGRSDMGRLESETGGSATGSCHFLISSSTTDRGRPKACRDFSRIWLRYEISGGAIGGSVVPEKGEEPTPSIMSVRYI